ncbi:MAG: glycosyltransferase family 2 protein [Clostridia bacterium]|nr:glycosyltransferase family 2 protein [Clostridia bacterium]
MVNSISVLLAAYNGETYLPCQLASLAAQTGVEFRVLMQDDGSTDATPSLLADMAEKDSRFQVMSGGGHLGAIGNFWSLLCADDAPYTALCDQDDAWAPDRLARCMEAMKQAEAAYGKDTPLLVHSDCRVMAEDGTVLQESFFAHQGWDTSAVTLPRLLVQNNVTGCTVLMNAPLRQLAAKYGRPETMHMHDWFLALTAAAFGHIVFVNEPLVDYRQHGKNVLGASRQTLTKRGFKALSAWEKGKARIKLTYTHARAFRDACGDNLPREAARIIDDYLATETMMKPRRLMHIRRGGYLMQSKITRMGQMIFG